MSIAEGLNESSEDIEIKELEPLTNVVVVLADRKKQDKVLKVATTNVNSTEEQPVIIQQPLSVDEQFCNDLKQKFGLTTIVAPGKYTEPPLKPIPTSETVIKIDWKKCEEEIIAYGKSSNKLINNEIDYVSNMYPNIHNKEIVNYLAQICSLANTLIAINQIKDNNMIHALSEVL